MNHASVLVFDIGKTHVKVTLLDADGNSIFSRRSKNSVVEDGLYPHFDVDGIWAWFVDQVAQLSRSHDIDAISIATHGAAAVLVDLSKESLLLPVMDYEFDEFPIAREIYEEIRPDFAQTYSPSLPAGLNLGRQLHWQLQFLTSEQRQRLTILPYANYWSWRLTGIPCWEVSSLGCHTDLWNPDAREFSGLVETLGISNAFPVQRWATEPLGYVKPEVAELTGLPTYCQVWPGMHDSNAGYAPYLAIPSAERPSVISSGTWSIVLAPSASTRLLDQHSDMLANTDISGEPVATARFMGGREFGAICEMTDCDVATHCDLDQVRETIVEHSFALPSFAKGTGPFSNIDGTILGPAKHGKAVAALYCALMLDHILNRLEVSNPIAIEGSFANNSILCGLLATLRPDQPVMVAKSGGSVVDGCWRVTNPRTFHCIPDLTLVSPFMFPEIDRYRQQWRELIKQRSSEVSFRAISL